MSLFCSLKLIKDVNSSLTPKAISESDACKISQSIRFNSPKLTAESSFLFPPAVNRLRAFSENITREQA